MPTLTDSKAPAAGAPVGPIVPFVRAAFEHAEPSNFDKSNAISASSIQLGPEDVIAFGYLRSLLIYVTATGGTGTAAVYKEDAPWNVIQELQLNDVNGAQIVGPISGYDLYLINVFGGYSGYSNPAQSDAYTAPATSGNFAFVLRVPVELSSRDGLGAIANMNSSSTYKLRIVQAPTTDVYSTNPTGLPTIRVRAWAECWAAPSGSAPNGAPQAVQPPALGTTQFWTVQNYLMASGANTVQLKRVGNLVRGLLMVFRNTSDGLRSTTNFPDPFQIWLDGKLITNEARAVRRHYMSERLNAGGLTLPTGVIYLDFIHDFDGLYGGEMRDQWLPTASSTRLELQGSAGAAGTLRVLTNDVAPVGSPYVG
jgi:hypothetical protein